MATMQRHGQLDAGISAGNTGAFVAAAQMHLHRLRGVHRPGISIVTPTAHGPVAICDVGANVNCRPQHLHQYGVMASTYVNLVCRVKSPRIGLLSIGEEDAKGNDLVKEARALLRRDPSLNFIGNVEGRDLFRGVCDVMLCDGFVGNVVLKLMEGMAEGVVLSLLGELAALLPNGGSEILAKATGAIKSKYDFNEYGGAPLLGVGGICIICHGASDYRGVKNAVRVAMEFSRHQVNQQIIELLCRDQRALHG
jgi:glycerol-3-phosphate acyltransferase PlsX